MKRPQGKKHIIDIRHSLRLSKRARQCLQARQHVRQRECPSTTNDQAQVIIRFLPKVGPDGKTVLVDQGGGTYRACKNLFYRCTKNRDDRDWRLFLRSGLSVEGTDEGDGWVKTHVTGKEHELLKNLVETNEWVLSHLKQMGVGQDLVEQVEKALSPTSLAHNVSISKPSPLTMVEQVFGYVNTGWFNVDVYKIDGYVGSVAANATTTTEMLAEKISKLTKIPVLHLHLAQDTTKLRTGKAMADLGVSPMQNRVTALRTEEYPENPLFGPRTLLDLFPSGRMPSSVEQWKEVQNVVWPGFPPLKDGWIRVVSRTSFRTYFVHGETGDSRCDFAAVRADAH